MNRDHVDTIVFIRIFIGNRSPESLTDILGQNFGIFRNRSVIGQSFKNRGQVVDRNVFFKQILKNLFDFAQTHDVRNQFIDDDVVVGLDAFKKLLHFLSAKKLRRTRMNDFLKVRCNDRQRFDHREALQICIFLILFIDPKRIELKGRFLGRNSLEREASVIRLADDHVFVRIDVSVPDFIAANFDRIVVGVQIQVVSNADRTDQNSELMSRLPSDGGNSVHQTVVDRAVDQGNQAIADFNRQRLDLKRCHVVVFFLLFFFALQRKRLFFLDSFLDSLFLFLLDQNVGGKHCQ